MAIEIRQSGEAAAYGGLGQLAGEAANARQQQAYAERAASEARQMIHEQEMQSRAAQFQQARDQLQTGLELEAEKRKGLWEIEKAETRSRLDFEREEKERSRALNELSAYKKRINDDKTLSAEQKTQMMWEAEHKAMTGSGLPGNFWESTMFGAPGSSPTGAAPIGTARPVAAVPAQEMDMGTPSAPGQDGFWVSPQEAETYIRAGWKPGTILDTGTGVKQFMQRPAQPATFAPSPLSLGEQAVSLGAKVVSGIPLVAAAGSVFGSKKVASAIVNAPQAIQNQRAVQGLKQLIGDLLVKPTEEISQQQQQAVLGAGAAFVPNYRPEPTKELSPIVKESMQTDKSLSALESMLSNFAKNKVQIKSHEFYRGVDQALINIRPMTRQQQQRKDAIIKRLKELSTMEAMTERS